MLRRVDLVTGVFTPMMEVRSSETSILTRVTWRHIPEDGILHSHRRENLKSYITLTGWTLQRRRNVSPLRYEHCPSCVLNRRQGDG
jgi:hypothetical protein